MYINGNLESKQLKWRGSITLMLMQKIFCEKGGPADQTRGDKQAGALSYLGMIDCGQSLSMYNVMRDTYSAK